MTASYAVECGAPGTFGYSGGTHLHSEYLTSINGALLYSALGHVHSGYAPTVHTHAYSPTGHSHDYLNVAAADLRYSLLAHTHAALYLTIANAALDYSPIAHVHEVGAGGVPLHTHSEYIESAAVAAGYSAITHNHGGIYSTLSHDHNLVYSALAHTHAYSPTAHTHAYVLKAGDTMTGVLGVLPAAAEGTGQYAGSTINLGFGRSANGNTFLDLIGDTTYTDYGLRIIRETGPNGPVNMIARGTGGITLRTSEAGAITFLTAGATRLTLPAAGGADFSAGLTTVGNVGAGVASPQGILHAHDGTGGMGLFTRTGVNATAQVLIPNGAGDVTREIIMVAGFLLLSNGLYYTLPGTVTTAYPNEKRIAKSTELSMTSGSEVYRLRVNADGSVDFRRTAGTTTATLSIELMWV